MPTRGLAKQAAALECVRMLFELGQLDARLLPTAKVEALKNMEEILGADFQREEVEPGTALPGTRRRRQYYLKRTASLLSHCRPIPQHPTFLYVISIATVQRLRPDPATKFVENECRGIGILSREVIPSMPAFNIYLQKTEYRIDVELVGADFLFDQRQMEDVKSFHAAVYEQVLRFSDAIAVQFDAELEGGALYAVPLRRTRFATNQSKNQIWKQKIENPI